MAQNNIPVIETYWSLSEKADRKFSRVRDLPCYGKNRYDSYFPKVFRIYTQLWKFQQENRQKLVEAGLKRWEIGEIASRIAQLYYGQYLRTSEANYLSESYIFYEAILSREYFKEGSAQDLQLASKQLRCLARFLIVCLVLNRREMVHQLVNQLRILLDECRRSFQETNFKEWKQVVQEIVRFLKVDTAFMNIRPLRYSYVIDSHPDSLPYVASVEAKRGLRLRDAILSSYHHNEVKFTVLTLDAFRMLQCLEWEPSGSFYQTRGTDISGSGSNLIQNGGAGPNHATFLQEITDPTLPPNPRKAILYRPAVTHFISVLATICEELPSDGVLLIYLSAEGKSGHSVPLQTGLGSFTTTTEKIVGNFHSLNMTTEAHLSSPIHSPCGSPSHSSIQDKSHSQGNYGVGLWLGSRCNGGFDCLYPCDLIPFTRRPLVLIIDSDSSYLFKAIHGAEKGETAAMLLSPSSPSPAAIMDIDSARVPGGSQFTMFLTAPLQAFCYLLGYSGSNVNMGMYHKADKLLSSVLNEWGMILATSDSLDPVWAQVLCDPFLRRLLLRFIFCRAVIACFAPTFNKKEFLPECVPHLPESVLPTSATSQQAILRLANIFDVTNHFIFSDGITLPENESYVGEPTLIRASDIREGHFAADNGH
ncbi:protein SCAI isoform X1 [Cinnamomum micranthum f. kanehirae]|uniref:Protein SCAI isoform X1 n=1 Tax=Cinnamomum micranthum f. kanehirae TaxID=337451 RepID=A0A3S3N307_9MAGN|nr:protein SCAI isoform X1 [Cinnamomum micranthum f. kanehirae]